MSARPMFLRGLALAGVLCACDVRTAYLPNTPITPDQHTINFPINIDGGVHTVDCNMCHGDFDTFSQFSCTSACHAHDQAPMDSAHIQITAAYVWSATGCYQCHPQGVVPQGQNCLDGGLSDGGFQSGACFDHGPFFPIRPGQLHDGCSDQAVIAALAAQGRNLSVDAQGLTTWVFDGGLGVQCPPFPNEGGIQCVDCHPNPNDHRVPYLAGSPGATAGACLDCHPTPGMEAVHDAGLGPGVWRPDTTTCLSVGCHAQGGLR